MHEPGYTAMPKLWEGGPQNKWLVRSLVIGAGEKKSLVQSKSKKWFTNSRVDEIYPKSFGVDVHCILNGNHYQNIARFRFEYNQPVNQPIRDTCCILKPE